MLASGAQRAGLNLVLNLASSHVADVITSTLATHFVDIITSASWWQLRRCHRD
jgi:hypothetical protein